jgi:DNA-binding response OmpR family regulator
VHRRYREFDFSLSPSERIAMNRVLIVEDSLEAFELVRRAMGTSVQLDWAKSLHESSALLDKKTFDLILLDVTLPDGDGFRLCSLLQANDELKGIPVIFLTARNSIPDKVMGFSVGADDYISKPFDPIELKARVEAKFRRREREKSQAQLIRAGDLEINKDSQKVCIYDNGHTVDIELTPIEFKILIILAKEANKVFSRDELLNSVWGESIHVYSRSVDTHVSKLRKKLGDKAYYIESVHGTGYRFALSETEPTPIDLREASDSLLSGGNIVQLP